jgi:hypothetical protein
VPAGRSENRGVAEPDPRDRVGDHVHDGGDHAAVDVDRHLVGDFIRHVISFDAGADVGPNDESVIT